MTLPVPKFSRALVCAVAALIAAGCATADPTAQPSPASASAAAADAPSFPYVVLEENARITFASRIDSFSVDDDDAIIFRAGLRQYYRATLFPGCGRDAQFEFAIGLPHRALSDLSRFDSLIIDGRRCPIRTLDRIENPRLTRERLAAEAAAGGPSAPPPSTRVD